MSVERLTGLVHDLQPYVVLTGGETLRPLADALPGAGSDAAKTASRNRPASGDVASANTGTTRFPANDVEK